MPPKLPDPLAAARDLGQVLDDPDVRIVDVRWYLGDPERGRAEYEAGHIPGAVFADLDLDLSAPDGPGRHPLPDKGAFADTMSRLGLGDDHLIVAYDSSGGSVAARLWWMLRWIGHPGARVLDGGIQAWVDAGENLDTDTPEITPGSMTVRPSASRTIDRETLVQRMGSVALIDARARERYRGDTEPVDAKAGHIPSAGNVPFVENLAADGRFLPPALLGARYRFEVGDAEPVVYCGSGVNACHAALAMVVAGFDEPTLYPGSWSDWSSTDLPIETGDDPHWT